MAAGAEFHRNTDWLGGTLVHGNLDAVCARQDGKSQDSDGELWPSKFLCMDVHKHTKTHFLFKSSLNVLCSYRQ